MFHKKIETFSFDEIKILLRGASSTSHAVSHFEVFLFLRHIVLFCQSVFEGLEVLKNWSRSKDG